MDKKRDRMVRFCFHRSTSTALLFPYVCYMSGEGAAFGDAIELPAPLAPAAVGKQIVRLLRVCRKADIEELKNRRMEQLRSYWRSGEVVKAESTLDPTWQRLFADYPALTKDPGTYLRQFRVCQIVERDGRKYWKLVIEKQSKHRGCTVEGESHRIPMTVRPTQLGMQILELVAE